MYKIRVSNTEKKNVINMKIRKFTIHYDLSHFLIGIDVGIKPIKFIQYKI